MENEAYFEEVVKSTFTSWQNDSETIYYIHPTERMIKRTSDQPIAASSITCIDRSQSAKFPSGFPDKIFEDKEHHFVAVNVSCIPNHETKKDLLQRFLMYLNTPWHLTHRPIVAVRRCIADISEHQEFLLEGMENEACVRFVIANPIIDMLCRYFNYRVTLEESDISKASGDPLNTSPGSRYDYVCWKLMFKNTLTETYTPVVVLETKHQAELNLKAAAQAIGYYSRAKKNIDSTGFALLLNEWTSQDSCNERKSRVSCRIVLFPYKKGHRFGAQALLLPITTSFFDEFVTHGNILKLICTMCGVLEDTKPFTVTLPSGLELVSTGDLLGVYSKEALKDLQHQKEFAEKDEEIEKLTRELRKREWETKYTEKRPKI